MTEQERIAAFAATYPLSEFIDSTGARWGFRSLGASGRPLLMLPGASGTSEFFLDVAPALAATRRVILIDYPGGPEPDGLATGLVGLMDRLGLGQTDILGSSYAAYWGQILARDHAGRIDRLVLANGFTSKEDLAGNPLFDTAILEATDARTLQGQWLERARQAPHPVLGPLMVRAMEGGLQADDLRGRLLQVSRAVPITDLALPQDRITILDCQDDAIIPAAARDRLRQRFPGATHLSAKGGHYPYATEPAAYTACLTATLEV